MPDPKISVIIPIYNPGPSLEACLQSVIMQSLKDIEIICIDNNSTDQSVRLIQKLQKKDNRIILDFEKDQGASYARNKGISLSRGDYLIFMDSDDYYPDPLCLEILYKTSIENMEAIVRGNIRILNGKGTLSEPQYNGISMYNTSTTNIFWKDDKRIFPFFHHTTYLIPKRIITEHNIRVKNFTRGQDPLFLHEIISKFNGNILWLNRDVYYYRQRHNQWKFINWDYTMLILLFKSYFEMFNQLQNNNFLDPWYFQLRYSIFPKIQKLLPRLFEEDDTKLIDAVGNLIDTIGGKEITHSLNEDLNAINQNYDYRLIKNTLKKRNKTPHKATLTVFVYDKNYEDYLFEKNTFDQLKSVEFIICLESKIHTSNNDDPISIQNVRTKNISHLIEKANGEYLYFTIHSSFDSKSLLNILKIVNRVQFDLIVQTGSKEIKSAIQKIERIEQSTHFSEFLKNDDFDLIVNKDFLKKSLSLTEDTFENIFDILPLVLLAEPLIFYDIIEKNFTRSLQLDYFPHTFRKFRSLIESYDKIFMVVTNQKEKSLEVTLLKYLLYFFYQRLNYLDDKNKSKIFDHLSTFFSEKELLTEEFIGSALIYEWYRSLLYYSHLKHNEINKSKPKYRIACQGNSLTVGGAELVTQMICNYLSSHGYEVTLITTNNNTPDHYLLLKGVQRERAKSFDEATEYIVKNNFDAVIIHNYSAIHRLQSELEILKEENIKTFLVMHSGFFKFLNVGRYQTFLDMIFSFSRATVLVTLTNQTAMTFRLFLKNVTYIPNPIKNIPMKISNLKGKILLSVGRFTSGDIKRPDRLLYVFERVKHIHSDAQLVLVGPYDIGYISPETGESLSDIIQRNGWTEKDVTFTGSQENVFQFYEQASLYIHTSTIEGFPLTFVESALHGLPRLALEFQGINDLITNDFDGFFFPQDSIEEMSRKINYLLSNTDELKRLGNNALLIKERVSIDNIGQKWENLISLTCSSDEVAIQKALDGSLDDNNFDRDSLIHQYDKKLKEILVELIELKNTFKEFDSKTTQKNQNFQSKEHLKLSLKRRILRKGKKISKELGIYMYLKPVVKKMKLLKNKK